MKVLSIVYTCESESVTRGVHSWNWMCYPWFTLVKVKGLPCVVHSWKWKGYQWCTLVKVLPIMYSCESESVTNDVHLLKWKCCLWCTLVKVKVLPVVYTRVVNSASPKEFVPTHLEKGSLNYYLKWLFKDWFKSQFLWYQFVLFMNENLTCWINIKMIILVHASLWTFIAGQSELGGHPAKW